MNLRRPLWLIIIAAFVLVTGCSNTAAPRGTNLEIINASSARIGTIVVQAPGESHGGQNADNSPLAKGEKMYFALQKTNSFTVELYAGIGASKGSALASQNFSWDFSQGKLTLRIVDNGTSVAIVKSVP